ncbi:hypothetical protein HU147_18595 [Planomicrobium chinense]|uniref:hypothetical protein n=1 Tax=Planococcus chinensis TaxID=272917 RepID=UPI001CC5E414|nr:hypothetical protein [Planococcus chinensis]MBZ5203216.1 hypothetical protein [Planococcus chinensis]
MTIFANKCMGYENTDAKERLKGYKVQTDQEEKQPDTTERYQIFNAAELVTIGDLSVGEIPHQMERVEIPESLLLKQGNEKLKAHIASLEERHVKESQLIDELRRDVKDANKERYAEIERGDEWRTKYRNIERELNKVKEAHSIKVSNLENEVKRLDQALHLHAEDETLLFLTMQKAVQMRSRVTESVEEGGRSTWI